MHKVVSRRTDFAPIRNVLSRWKYTLPKVHYVAVSEAVRQVLIASGIPAHCVQTIYSSIDVRRFNETLKDAIDPNGIISPGRAGVWPAAFRSMRGGMRS